MILLDFLLSSMIIYAHVMSCFIPFIAYTGIHLFPQIMFSCLVCTLLKNFNVVFTPQAVSDSI